MSTYFHRFVASSTIAMLDNYERSEVFGDTRAGERFDMLVFEAVIEQLKGRRLTPHLDTETNSSWEAFRAAHSKAPAGALGECRSLRERLRTQYFKDGRTQAYFDSGIFMIDDVPLTGFEPEGLRIVAFLSERAGDWVTTQQIKMGIDMLKPVDVRTVRRFIGRLCPIVRDLIESKSGKGHLFELPAFPFQHPDDLP